MDINNIQVVEYSVSQRAYHLQSLKEMLEKNNTASFGERPSDYMTIGIFNSYEAADTYIKWHRNKMENLRTIRSNYEPEKSTAAAGLN